MQRLTIIVAAALAIGTLANTLALAETGAERRRACAAEWHKAKADPAVKAKGWPKFFSACNTARKAASK